MDPASLASLHTPHPASPRNGYFPLGFVHGNPRLTLDQGYTFRQLPSSDLGFADGVPGPPTPLHQAREPFFYHSLAIAGESLASRLAAGAGRGTYSTTDYGELPLSVDARGVPWTRALDRLDLFDPGTRRYLADYVRHHVRTRSAGSLRDRILLWGLDNEWEGRANHSPAARAAFQLWLESAYAGNIAALNQAWGASHPDFAAAARSASLTDTEPAIAPGRFLDWWHFQSKHFTAFLAFLARLAWETDPLHRGVVHKATQLTIEMPAWRERLLDQAAFAEQMRSVGGGFYGLDIYGHGDRQAYETNYAYQCIRSPDGQPGHGVMLCENNNHDGPGPQFAATQWRLLANGVKGMMYFTTGFAGGQADWAHFGFVDPVHGHLREKMAYAPRWANLVHRSEQFWSESAPAPGLPRLALLLPRRDVLLSPSSRRNSGDLRYAYPENHRWLFFRWLREQGYWVDVIPYEKLQPDFLRGYQALCLIGARHLTAAECAVIQDFVHDGGRLLADAHAGRYDEHHSQTDALDPLLGLSSLDTSTATKTREWLIEEERVTASGYADVVLHGATLIADPTDAAPPSFVHQAKRGSCLYLPFQAGSLTLHSGVSALASIQSDAATAESEEYPAHSGEFAIGRWLAGLLRHAGIEPACPPTAGGEILRIEQPWTDARGNCIVIITTRAHSRPAEIAPAATHRLPLPAGPWACALWAPAENDRLLPVALRPAADGRHELDLPAVASAGALYLLKDHPPLLGIETLDGSDRVDDGRFTQVRPGRTFEVAVTLWAAASTLSEPGSLRLHGPADWTIAPERHVTPPLEAGRSRRFVFTVTPHDDDVRHRPDWLSPLVARWHDGQHDVAVATTCVEVRADPERIPRLLSDNESFPKSYPYRTTTGATYRYLEPADSSLIADPEAAGDGHLGTALVNGFSSIGGQRHSHHRDIPGAGHYARYRSTHVDILFDLQAEHEILRVVLVAGPGEVYPSSVQILVGPGETHFTPAVQLAPAGPQLEIETPPFSRRGRHVRVVVDWPREGGTLDEIEIWGR